MVRSAPVPFVHQRVCLCLQALQASNYESEIDHVITVGDYSILRWTYSHSTKQLTLDESWTEQYRRFMDGSFPGTGPALYNGTVFYTDNTFPVLLGAGYRVFAKSLYSVRPQTTMNIAPNTPGFMFWSVVINPLMEGAVIWDTHNAKVQSRSLVDLSLQWELDAYTLDCISVSADKGHVYLTDTGSKRPRALKHHMEAVSKFGLLGYKDMDKFFVVANSTTGGVLARIPIAVGEGLSTSVVIPGSHGDVYMGTRDALVRVYVPVVSPILESVDEEECSSDCSPLEA
jgi:hypothetical protein